MVLQILKVVAAVGTIATGIYAIVRPSAAQQFTGLFYTSGRGVTEIRSVLGGLFVALGVVPVVMNQPAMYLMLGIAYLAIAAVRLVSMFVDKSVVQSNVISLAVEIVFGVILVL
ncbi:MAG: DUF4345 domain-containing protein [Anaerolineae bacterium]|nr:DUF4345 domain-containing protein [Anaerolineae bacterium]